MGIFITALLGILGKLPGMVGDYFKKKQEIDLARIQLQQEKQLQTLKNDGAIAVADSERATAVVNNTLPWFSAIIFSVFSVPFLACLLNYPEYATMVFANLTGLPDWYAVTFTGIVGLKMGLPVGGKVMDYATEALMNRRAYKLAKMGVDPKAFFDAMRDAKGGILTQADVDEGNRVLAKLNENNKG